jgi:hypothetical protein
MAITLPCYATREEVKRALDVKESGLSDVIVDGAIDSARADVEGLCHRRFYNVIQTNYWDWPNFQRAYPWRIWFDERELADTSGIQPTVTTGGQSIPDSAIFWGPWNYSPPFTFMELDRSQSYAFGVGSTPQRDVAITGLFGYWDKQASAGSLSAAISSTSVTTCTVSDGAAMGVGDVIIAGTERMLVQDKAMADTGMTQQGSGCSTKAANDNLLGVTDGTQFSPHEVLQLDAEQMLIESITGNSLTVKRAWNGTVLGAHSGADIYASRKLTITRGDLGSTAATHTQGTSLNIQVIPGLVKELAIAEAINHVLQRSSGYARTMAIPGAGAVIPGGSLPDIRNQCWTAFGRKNRQRVI